MLPLKSIKIVDLSRVLAGPLSTMLLADMGANVIKIEEPTRGDDTRSWLPPAAKLKPNPAAPHLPPESAYFLSTNRNKRSLALNLKHKSGQSIIKKLVKDADVFVENYLPGKLSEFGLGYEDIKSINPSIIYASITGYGQTGPFANAPGYDVLIEAEAGLMHITGEKQGNPVKVGVAITDITTGLYAHGAILAALFNKLRTGEGAHLDISLFESQIASLANIASNYLISGKEAERQGTSHPSIVPYQTFTASDGYIMIGAGNDKQFVSLAEVLGKDEWNSDERYKTNASRVKYRDELVGQLNCILSKQSIDYWLKKFKGSRYVFLFYFTFLTKKRRFSFGPINNIQRTFAHPQSLARNVVTEIEHPRIGNVKLTAPAIGYSGEKLKITKPPPYLGQHTNEVLREEGYTDDELLQFRKEGVVIDNSATPRDSKL
ncbi:CoA-transferase family III [Wallemia mellicola]|uniref:CoA-transferase family III n=1 Tax=Wallemia mellicola TaxID=1708541 RepID=A0A4T0T914_9BASI|nr:CoA-transferase family III [Wallemia mellicola]TIC07228.1 CoA-transferase family III [Wallemia mellicola]TIC23844.1 CoA-transferase family III [Wallemia mellicola]TIC61734.1 CoA-transferase family III [Wallemia mellicola]